MRSLLCILLLLLSGCWSPLLSVDDDLLPVNRVRDAGGAGGGGAAMTAGGSAMGGGSVTPASDGGTPFGASAVIAPVAGPLPEACNTSRDSLEARLRAGISLDAGCGNGCLYEVTQTSARGARAWAPRPKSSGSPSKAGSGPISSSSPRTAPTRLADGWWRRHCAATGFSSCSPWARGTSR
ncbi:MAG: hypothetical protein GQE15_31515 [Archangiaceae bacterium]|nr:hypothetical protein [Archangiaceae bacterium]